jgi:response regulator RpfG family c-di-GMP phosphodiesterase
MIKMATVFISYETTTGLEYAKHLQKALKKHDISSFVARADIEFGEDPSQTIQRNLEECKFFVPIITITALKSSEVRQEFLSAKELEKYIIPCIKEGVHSYVEAEFKEILNYQCPTFETKEDLANIVLETVLKEEISHYRESLRKLKEPITRKDIVDSFVSDLIRTRDEIYFWLTEPDADPNEQYIFRKLIDVVKKEENEELQRIRKDIIDHGHTPLA